ncbi:MAG: 2,3-diphosphoglycerate-dependent phosphoglycerate mutase [Patescibacteria group bacterium]|jgi:2,3-bisphosphoglycerate-dependent phosphoglycerate mutase
MYKVVLLRHGQSVWNAENRFTGWVDVGLTEKGMAEARSAGVLMREAEMTFDIAFTSMLQKAIRSLWLVQEELGLLWLPVIKSWRLNERHYGALQGLNKAEMAQVHGEEQIKIWRRSYDVRPPEIDEDSPYFTGNDPMYKDVPKELLPKAESLKDTVDRVVPCWDGDIVPEILQGRRVLIVAHGNSLRALIKHLDGMSPEEVINFNIPTGIPLVYELDDKLKPIRHYYLGDPEVVRRAIEVVAQQGNAK